MSTLTQVRTDVYRINNPAVCAALTRSGGVPSPKLHGRLVRAIVGDDVNAQLATAFEFSRGLKSKKWYVRKYSI